MIYRVDRLDLIYGISVLMMHVLAGICVVQFQAIKHMCYSYSRPLRSCALTGQHEVQALQM